MVVEAAAVIQPEERTAVLAVVLDEIPPGLLVALPLQTKVQTVHLVVPHGMGRQMVTLEGVVELDKRELPEPLRVQMVETD